ncbi:cytochrome C, partial [Campylobacter sp. RM13119]|nr:cytochrome C [Campylobacter sp. RM13119]
DMRNQLEYWKPSYKIYENKMLEQKIKSKQEFFKDEYEPTKQEREFLEKNVKKPANSH